METECNSRKLLFEAHSRREVSASFDGGRISSGVGGLLLALMCGRKDITGQDRVADGSRGVPLAGKSTLNHPELTPTGATKDSRYKKIVASIATLQDTLVDTFIRLRSHQGISTELTLDLNATDDPVHGDQSFGGPHRRSHILRRS